MTQQQFEGEQWRRCQWPAVRYEVSNLGRIRHARRKTIRPFSINNAGYAFVGYQYKGKFTPLYVHRAVAIAFVPGYALWLEVDHVNGCKTDNRAVNLQWVTHSENMRRWWQKRKQAQKGGRNHD